MRARRSNVLVEASKGADIFGDAVVQLVLRLAIAAVLVVRSWWRRLGAWAFLVVLSSPIDDLVKSLVDRPRPANGLVHAGGAAFPSGHTLTAAVTALGIVLDVRPARAGPRRRMRRCRRVRAAHGREPHRSSVCTGSPTSPPGVRSARR